MCYSSQGVPHAFFADNHGCGDTSYIRRAESHVHWYEGSIGSSHHLPYADDAGSQF